MLVLCSSNSIFSWELISSFNKIIIVWARYQDGRHRQALWVCVACVGAPAVLGEIVYVVIILLWGHGGPDVEKGTCSMATTINEFLTSESETLFTIASNHNSIRPFSTQTVVSDISNRHDRDSTQQTCTRWRAQQGWDDPDCKEDEHKSHMWERRCVCYSYIIWNMIRHAMHVKAWHVDSSYLIKLVIQKIMEKPT